ncbi:zinc finger protein 436-like [Condylostylus longicornis]|uniref:zinc finger protein 436-like n=1 Tax=Condylostylus longicornis TaxID=2530218 RepID=UPI00244DAE0E|nr:zinc finger protein 436-like [Condylostylus longicornis]
MALVLSNMCRTCLETEKPCMIPLFDKKPGKASSVFEMFQSITSIKAEINDGLPEKICIACFTEINRAYSFKIKCEASEQTLRKLIGISKSENEENYSSDENVKTEIGENDEVELENTTGTKKAETYYDKDEHFEDNIDNIDDSEFSDGNEDLLMNNKLVLKNDTEYIFEEEPSNPEKKESNSQGYGKSKNVEDHLQDGNSETSNLYKTLKINENDPDVTTEIPNSTSESSTTGKKRSKEPIKCPHCPSDFVFLKNLNKHLEWHKKAFETQSHFKKNTAEIAPAENECAISLPKEEIVFETSTIGVHGEEILTATTIDEIVEESAIEPIVKDIPESCAYNCENCGAGFQTERSLNFHRKLNRCTEKQFECLVCHKIFISKVTLIEHIKIHTENFQCSKCMKEFDSEEDFKNHMDNEHVSGKSIKNQCPICKKCFTMLSALKDHMRVHSGEKPFICETCGRGFSQSTNLKQHTMRHSNTKPFKCAQCPCEFVSKGELNSHMRKHTGEHPFVCDTCGSGFTTSSSLKKHIRIHTGERPYACDFCPMRFAALGTLKNHRRTHTGEKPYLCRFCGRGFAQQSDRVTHERTHTGERPYVCSVCGSAFQQNGALKIHMKLHADGRNSQSTAKKRKINNDSEKKTESLPETN